MQTLFFNKPRGHNLQLCDVTRPPRGRSWQRQYFTRGQASVFVQSMSSHELRSLTQQLSSRYRIGLISPATGLAQLLESNRLGLYRRHTKALTRRTRNPPKQHASELRLAIAASLKLIISQERAEALAIDKAHQRKGRTGKAVAHVTALGQGLLASGADLLNWLTNINDVVNPLWRLKRRIDAALITYEECTGASNSCLTVATRASYLKRVELADHRELVEALGFDPTNIDRDAFSQAWHSAWVLAGDKQVVAMITDFAKNYIDAQHALKYSQAAGGAVFEVLLALLLAATTAGTGIALAIASKGRHAGEFGRIGRKLILLAEALEGSPRGIVRRRGKTTRVVDDRRGQRSSGEQVDNKVVPRSTALKSVADDAPNSPTAARDANGVLRAADGRYAPDPSIVSSQLNRPSLRSQTKTTIEVNAPKNPQGQFIDQNGQVIADTHFGHITGHENRRILSAADELALSQSQLNDYVNARPQFFKIEDAKRNFSHADEIPGRDNIDHIVIDMEDFFGL